MELLEASINILYRFLVAIGIVHLFEKSEALLHKYIFTSRMQRNIGHNSDLMHAITIVVWGIVIALVLYAIVHISTFLQVDACLDSGGAWNYKNETCNK